MENIFTMGSNKMTPYAPTINSSNDIYLNNCSECGRTRYNDDNKDLSLVIEGKRKLPDYLLCGHYPLTIVSKKVIEIWRKYSVTGYTAFPIKKLVDKKGTVVHSDFQYFNVSVTGSIELDFKRMGVSIVNQCSICGCFDFNKNTWEFGTAFLKQGTHDGSDLFYPKYSGGLCCTRKMLEIVYKEKLTNFKFNTFESMFIFINSPPAIDLKEFFRNI